MISMLVGAGDEVWLGSVRGEPAVQRRVLVAGDGADALAEVGVRQTLQLRAARRPRSSVLQLEGGRELRAPQLAPG